MQMAAKVVYYGPGLCGKTTNLHHIYRHTTADSRGEMVSLETETDRTLFFDLLPHRRRLRSAASRPASSSTPSRAGLLQHHPQAGAQGRGRRRLRRRLAAADAARPTSSRSATWRRTSPRWGCRLDTLPLVLQYNKRDLRRHLHRRGDERGAQPRRLAVTSRPAPCRATGVFETLQGDLPADAAVAQEAALAGGARRRPPARRSARSVGPVAAASAARRRPPIAAARPRCRRHPRCRTVAGATAPAGTPVAAPVPAPAPAPAAAGVGGSAAPRRHRPGSARRPAAPARSTLADQCVQEIETPAAGRRSSASAAGHQRPARDRRNLADEPASAPTSGRAQAGPQSRRPGRRPTDRVMDAVRDLPVDIERLRQTSTSSCCVCRHRAERRATVNHHRMRCPFCAADRTAWWTRARAATA